MSADRLSLYWIYFIIMSFSVVICDSKMWYNLIIYNILIKILKI